MSPLLAFTYVGLGAIVAAVEFQRIKVKQPMNALTLFNGAYFLFFVVVPLNVIWFGELVVRQKYAYQAWSHGGIWTALALIASYVAFVVGYRRQYSCRRSTDLGGRESLRIATLLAGIYFMVGILSLAYHLYLVGGVTDAILKAPSVRTGEFPLEGDMLFIRQFNYFLATAFMLGWAIYIDTDGTAQSVLRYRRLVLVVLGLAFVYYALTTYGRREFLYPMMICLIGLF